MNRRQTMLLGGAGVAAAAGGLWLGARRLSTDDSATLAPEGLWSLRLARPEGGELVLADFKGRPLLLNFWATWCPPCIRELPDLNRFHDTHSPKGWQVVGLAVDGPTPVREFLTRMPLSFPVGLAGLEGADLSRSLGNTSGALPFTVVFDPRGRIRHRKLGVTNREELAQWASTV
ncbi:MAG: hypothetical protein RI949_818 [Pseudomonadota bacterium]|jgi:thiol-disulfide isomerase/thioredoxin